MLVKVLIDNISKDELLCEWGLSVYIEYRDKKILLDGGADNIIREVGETFPEKSIYALFGGLHLHESADEDVRALAERVRRTGIRKIYTGHCTGDHALEVLKEELGDTVEAIYSGFTIDDM